MHHLEQAGEGALLGERARRHSIEGKVRGRRTGSDERTYDEERFGKVDVEGELARHLCQMRGEMVHWRSFYGRTWTNKMEIQLENDCVMQGTPATCASTFPSSSETNTGDLVHHMVCQESCLYVEQNEMLAVDGREDIFASLSCASHYECVCGRGCGDNPRQHAR